MRVGPSIGRFTTYAITDPQTEPYQLSFLLPKLASRHRLPQRVPFWLKFVTFESQKRSVVARSMAEAEYRADEKAPGPDGTLDFSKISGT